VTIAFDQVIPILRILDEAKAREFYLGFLGFKVDWEHRFDDDAPLYMRVSRAGLVLHLSEHYGDAIPGASVYVLAKGVEAFHREITAKRYRYLRPGLGEMDWGGGSARCLNILDPFGNRIRFVEPKDRPA